jgi:hypothetical protein
MNLLIADATLSLLASASAYAQTLTITRSGSRPSQPAPRGEFHGFRAIQEHLDGTRVRRMEKVNDEQYNGRSAKELFQ